MAAACEHITDQAVNIPGPTQSVYREDCTQCFASIDDPDGLNVCLSCFNGGCAKHNPLHVTRTGHNIYLNIRRTKKHRDEPPPKLSKLAIAAESEADRYDTQSYVFCTACSEGPITSYSGKLKESVDAVSKAPTFARQAEVKAWEQELAPCEHTLCLVQDQSRAIPSQGRILKLKDRLTLTYVDLGQCSLCDLKENLWLCLTCGNLGCGRSQFGSDVKGNSHALAHGTETNHPVAVKLGSITPDGTADIYCYSCNDERTDPELTAHLAAFGINIAEREKTEKSLTEMQIEQNLKWDFSMTTDDGQELRPIFGKGLTGLKNLGNSCYMSSTLQCLFSLPAFQSRYYRPSSDPPDTSAPAEDLETQLQKVADGLLSGDWSRPDNDVSTEGSELPYQKGLAPAMLKHLIGRGHAEFSTMRQQDAFEFLLHIFKLITRSSQTAQLPDPTKSFRFMLDERLQCSACRKVRYQPVATDNISIPVPVRRKTKTDPNTNKDAKAEFEPVTLKECLERFTGTETVDLTCASCGSKDGYYKRNLFKTFPDTLAVNAQRFEIVNWVPTKLDIPVVVGDESFELDEYRSSGLRQDEESLPEEADTQSKFIANEAAMAQLEAMGFPKIRCEKALHATGNSDAESAMNWLFAHMEDPDIDQPVELSAPSNPTTGGQVNQESVDMVVAMGIEPAKARKALKETGGDIERAVDWVFSHPDDPGEIENAQAPGSSDQEVPGSDKSPATYRLKAIICHKGASIHAGHYVAFVRKTIEGDADNKDQWVLFNDEKVVHAADVEEMKKFAYVYFFERL